MTNFNLNKAENMLRGASKALLVEYLAKFMCLSTNRQKPDSTSDSYCFGWNASRDCLKEVICADSDLLRYIYSCCDE